MAVPTPLSTVSRRTVTGVAAAGVSVPLLAACGADDSSSASDTSSAPASSAPASSSAAAPTDGATSEGTVAEGLTSTSDIEVGGGAIFADEKVVITQPTAGEFKCFSAVCTHQGCLLASVSDGTMNCDCHGSTFNLETGEPESGPASSALEEVDITVNGDQISLS
jgi:Rieske Fe-S protein